jgi:transposase
MNEPHEVADEEHEQIVARVAAVDVAKASGMVCTRVPHDTKPGRRLCKVWNVAATTNAITELADHLVCQGIERIVLESTSDYWRPWFYLFEARGLTVWPVNANQVKQVPGRPKTDLLTELWGGSGGSGRQLPVGGVTFPGHDRREGRRAGSVPVGGRAARVA